MLIGRGRGGVGREGKDDKAKKGRDVTRRAARKGRGQWVKGSEQSQAERVKRVKGKGQRAEQREQGGRDVDVRM